MDSLMDIEYKAGIYEFNLEANKNCNQIYVCSHNRVDFSWLLCGNERRSKPAVSTNV